MKEYVVYKRPAVRDHGFYTFGVKDQQRMVDAFIEKRGGKVIASYTESKLVSGYNELTAGIEYTRPALCKAIDHVKVAKASLLVARTDCIARNVFFIGHLVEELKVVLTVTNLDTHTDEGDMVLLMSSAGTGADYQFMKEFHADFLAKQTEAAAYEAYRPIYTRLLSMRECQWTDESISERLNHQGLLTHTGKKWTEAEVAKVMKLGERSPEALAWHERKAELKAKLKVKADRKEALRLKQLGIQQRKEARRIKTESYFICD